jgi:hypothetical protein
MVPKKYIPSKLNKADKKKVRSELKKSREKYKKKEYYVRKKVKGFKSKPSSHVTKAKKLYEIDNIKPSRSLVIKTGCSMKGLKRIVKKGEGAYYSSGSRPNQTAQSWGRARLASAITGGKAAAVDFSILEEECKPNSKALKLAKQAKKKYGSGKSKVKKVKL